ncbi:TetR/AcrR family transcriptional regulator [Bacillus tianshenii]|nr:TetR/AcrR family transcriptional regulator [Bacillus tianshenii]
MNGFEKRREKKKNDIRQAALDLFAEDGVQKVNIQQIAEKANVSQVTIYNYFGSKDGLVYEVVQTLFEQEYKCYKQIMEENESFREKIQGLMKHKVEFASSYNPDFIFTLISERPDIQSLVQTYTEEKTMPLFIQLIQQGKGSGDIHPSISEQAIMFYMNMFANEMRNYPQAFQTQNELKQFTEEMLHLFFYGLIGSTHKEE